MIDGRISSEVNKNYAVSLADHGVYSGTTSIKTTLNNTIAQNANHQAVVEEMELALPPELLTIDEIATEVIRGDWGNGEERKRKLEEAGYNYYEVQGLVNEKLTGFNTYESQEKNDEYKKETVNFERISLEEREHDTIENPGKEETVNFERRQTQKTDLPELQDDNKKETVNLERISLEERDYDTIENPNKEETVNLERISFEERDYETIANPGEKETQTFVNSIDVNIAGNQDAAYTKFNY